MVELKKSGIVIGVITLIALAAIGVEVLQEDTHYCADLQITKHCDRLSSSGRTCYPQTATKLGSKLCGTAWLEILREDYFEVFENNCLYKCPGQVSKDYSCYAVCQCDSKGTTAYFGELKSCEGG